MPHIAQRQKGVKNARADDAEQQGPQHKDDADSPEGAKLRPADLTVSFMKVSVALGVHICSSINACRQSMPHPPVHQYRMHSI